MARPEKILVTNVKGKQGDPGPKGDPGPQGNPGDISQIGGVEEISEIITERLTDIADLSLIFENNLI